MDRNTIIKMVEDHKSSLSRIYYCLKGNRCKISGGKANVITKDGAFLTHCTIELRGSNNRIILNYARPAELKESSVNMTVLDHCHISVHGSNNTIIIGSGTRIQNMSFCIEDNNNEIRLGYDVKGFGETELAAIEGTKIIIGDKALLSANIRFRTGDSHSILDSSTGKRINPSKDIVLGEHVWVGNTVTVLKGATIGGHSIIATSAVVTGKAFPSNSIIGGSPAKVLKEGVDWEQQRLPVE